MTVRGVPVGFEWINATRIRLVTATGGGDAVVIFRKTPIDQALVEFQAGSVLTEDDLNKAIRQTLFIQQELSNAYETSLEAARIRLGANLGIVTTPDELMDQLVQMSLASDVLEEFRSRIVDIDLNAESIIQTALRTDALQNAVDTLSSLGDGAGVATVIEQERTERIEGDTALAQVVDLIGAVSDDSKGFILNSGTVKVSPTESLAQKLDTIGSQFETAKQTLTAAIAQEASARTSADGLQVQTSTQLAGRIDRTQSDLNALGDTLGKKVSVLEGSVTNEASLRLEGDKAQADALSALAVRVDSAAAAVSQEAKARADADSSAASLTTKLASRVTDAEADISSAEKAIEDALDAIGRTQKAVTAAEAAIVSEAKTRADRDGALTQTLTEHLSRMDSFAAAIKQEAETRATETGAMASLMELLGAKSPNGASFVMDTSKVQVEDNVSLGNRLSGIDTQLGANSSAIVSEATARTTATNSLSQRIDGVISTVGRNTASITQLFEARDGLYLKAGISLDNNGYITGWSLNNDGRFGDFVIRADRLALVAQDGRGNPVIPFEVTKDRIKLRSTVDIEGDLIVDGSITNKNVRKDTITAITASYNAALLQLRGTSPTPVQTCWIDVEGSQTPVLIDFNCFLHLRHDAGGTFTSTVDIMRSRNGTEDGTSVLSMTIEGSGMANDTYHAPMPLKVLDRPGPGTWCYYVRIRQSTSDMTIQTARMRFLSVTEHKTN